MPSLRLIKKPEKKESRDEDLGGQMSFLEHLDELRTRLIRVIVFVFIATSLSWLVADRIYNFLARPVNRALAEAQQQRQVSIDGLYGKLSTAQLNSLKQGDKIRFVFPEPIRLGSASIPAGASVVARVDKDS